MKNGSQGIRATARKTHACDCISRQEVLGLKTIAPIAPVMHGEAVHYEEVVFVRDLERLPSVEPQPKIGHWIDDKCSVCGKGTEDLISSSEWSSYEKKG